jgi:hypothetical protein
VRTDTGDDTIRSIVVKTLNFEPPYFAGDCLEMKLCSSTNMYYEY